MKRFFDFLRPDKIRAALTVPWELHYQPKAQERWLKCQVNNIVAKLKHILAKKNRHLDPGTVYHIRSLIKWATRTRVEFNMPGIIMATSIGGNHYADPQWVYSMECLYDNLRQTATANKRAVDNSQRDDENWDEGRFCHIGCFEHNEDEALENEEFSPSPRFLGIGRSVGQSMLEQEHRKENRKRAGKKRDRQALWAGRNAQPTRARMHQMKLGHVRIANRLNRIANMGGKPSKRLRRYNGYRAEYEQKIFVDQLVQSLAEISAVLSAQ